MSFRCRMSGLSLRDKEGVPDMSHRAPRETQDTLERLRLAWEHHGLLLEELEKVSGESKVWASLPRLLTPRSGPR
ncbi:hypothetical protein D4764_16G0010890 [Takifugu flavidus]|uniref:Uncharacterized protein n=1 Tax=Takifugu flavidus TaxID=433684 RepID=A0A5C6NYI8_9TELE|nr:hypothetical protein D4764_16G0010890 [Takifugu flavidus]